jgi:hypothetical protein
MALLLALTVLTACGHDQDGASGDRGEGPAAQSPSPSPSAGRGDDVDACALLTQVEVSEAAGGNQSTCEWFSVEHPADTAKLTIYSQTSAADSVRDSDPDAKPLPGVGDEAFVGAFASVWVYQGAQSFMAQWYSMTAGDEEHLPKSEALAKLAADRL